jgi:putative addiction module component (TIGR02574 family)
MEATIESLGIDRLSVAERLRLVQEIWDSITAEVETLEIPRSHKDELDRRIATDEANPRDGSTWEQIKAGLCKNRLP